MHEYCIKINRLEPHPSGNISVWPLYEVEFEGDSYLIAQLNLAISETILNFKDKQLAGRKPENL